MILVDSNVLLDVMTRDPKWSSWSVDQLERCSLSNDLAINDVVYAEISVGYDRIEQVDGLLAGMHLALRALPRSALFLAAKVHQSYRRNGGSRLTVLPDFFIGAQAAVEGLPLLTRDPSRYRTYFPTLALISP